MTHRSRADLAPVTLRRRLPWLVALPLMLGGSFGAHALSLALVEMRAGGEASELGERTSAAPAGQAVVVLGIAFALLCALFVTSLLRRIRGRGRLGVSPWLFFWLPPAAYVAQEVVERLLGAEAAPFEAALEPRFLVALALQLPFGLAALFAARALLQAVERICRALAGDAVPFLRSRAPARLRPVPCEAPRRLGALALGYSQRGPPPG